MKRERDEGVNVTAVLQPVNPAKSLKREGRIRRKENILARQEASRAREESAKWEMGTD